MEIIRFRYNKAGIKKEIEEIQLRQEYLKICLEFLQVDGFNVFVECGICVDKKKDVESEDRDYIISAIFDFDSISYMDVDKIALDAENREEIEKALEDIQLYLAGCRRLSRKRKAPKSMWEHPCLVSLSVLTVKQRMSQIQKEYDSLENDLRRYKQLLAIVMRFDQLKSSLDSNKVKGDVFTMETYNDVRMFSKLLIRRTENTSYAGMKPEDIPVDRNKRFPQKVVLLPFENDVDKDRYSGIFPYKKVKRLRNESYLSVALIGE